MFIFSQIIFTKRRKGLSCINSIDIDNQVDGHPVKKDQSCPLVAMLWQTSLIRTCLRVHAAARTKISTQVSTTQQMTFNLIRYCQKHVPASKGFECMIRMHLPSCTPDQSYMILIRKLQNLWNVGRKQGSDQLWHNLVSCVTTHVTLYHNIAYITYCSTLTHTHLVIHPSSHSSHLQSTFVVLSPVPAIPQTFIR